jgi:hypothetical protein
LADALAGRLCFLGLAGLFPSSRYITGTRLIAIEAPFNVVFVFSHLWNLQIGNSLNSGSFNATIFYKS